MSNVDLSQVITAQEKAAKQEAQRLEGAKAECAKRISAVFPISAQLNLAASKSAQTLTADQEARYTEALAWASEMRAAWRRLPQNQEWPQPPEGLGDLVSAF